MTAACTNCAAGSVPTTAHPPKSGPLHLAAPHGLDPEVVWLLGTNMPAQGAVGTIGALPAIIFQANADRATVAVVAMAILFFSPRSLDKWLPAPVAALVAGTALGALWLDEVAVIGAFPSGLPVPSLALPSLDFLLTAVEPALLIALIGSIFSLMMSLMADAITGVQHNPNRELIGQGIGNMAAGVLGAMPGAGNSGTLINLQFGGRTVVAGIARAACLLALLMGLGSYAGPIPLAAISAILIRAGWGLIDWRFLVRLRQMQRGHAAVMLLTLALTAFVDPLTAVAFGLVTAGIAHATRLERLELDSLISVPLLDRAFLGAGVDEGDADHYDARVGLLASRVLAVPSGCLPQRPSISDLRAGTPVGMTLSPAGLYCMQKEILPNPNPFSKSQEI